MKKIELRFTRNPSDSIRVGTLAEDRGRVFFEYASEFLETRLNLSPLRLPFEAGLFEHTDRAFGPLPGVFDDSLPDGWGLLLMDRHFRTLGLDPSSVSVLDRLAWLGTCTMGALTYHPPRHRSEAEAMIFDLHDLARNSRELLVGQAKTVLPQLLKAGGSPGGARPKVLVGYEPTSGRIISGEDDLPKGYQHWIIKFHARNEQCDDGVIEYAYGRMARLAGIDTPETHLFETTRGDRFFGVKRFDRDENRRFHVHTFGNLIQANFRIPSCDYADLFKATSLVTRDHRDLLKAFRRMVFNVLAHNRDDHVKNFAFVLNDDDKLWSLSPAYDLTYTNGPGGEHTMTVGGEGKQPSREQMFRLAEGAGIRPKDAGRIFDEVRAAVDRWPDVAQEAGLSDYPELCSS